MDAAYVRAPGWEKIGYEHTDAGKPWDGRASVDVVYRPSHYATLPVEPIEFIMRNDFEFWRGNIVKYASRAGRKAYDGMDKAASEIADLQKVIRYAQMRINQINGEDRL